MGRAVVTGGKGFIGSHFVQVASHKYEKIVVLDIGLTGDATCSSVNVEYHALDILDRESLLMAFEPGDHVFHFAAIARTPWCIEDPLLCHDTNLTGTANVLEAARQKRVARVVLSSSNVTKAGLTLYKMSKVGVENYAEVYAHLYGLSVIALRYSNVYGKGQREDGIGPNVFAALRKQKREESICYVTGNGEQSRDFTHVSDIVKANLLAAESNFTGTLDICTGTNHSINYVVKDLFGVTPTYVDERAGDVKHIYQDPAPAKKAIGFVASVELTDGITDVFDSSPGPVCVPAGGPSRPHVQQRGSDVWVMAPAKAAGDGESDAQKGD